MKEKYLSYFTDYLIDIKVRHTEGTHKFYKNHLATIGKYFYSLGLNDLSEVTKEVIVDFLSMQRRTVTNRTINHRLGMIKRCFLFYGMDEHYIHSVPKYREKKRSFDMIGSKDLTRIINYVTALDDAVGNNLLYKMIVLIFINTGVRLTELYNIEKKNINIKGNEILLTKTKNGKDRVVYFRPIITNEIKKMLQEEHTHKFFLHNRLRDRPVDYSDIKYIFNKIKKDLSINKLHPHMFRHTYATNLLRNGVDIKTVMDFMGHNNLSTTQRYMHHSKEHAKKSYLKLYKY